jgi:primosomal protein N' (replication factor Y)
MIAKGLDFVNATLVGIINADTGLYLPDYRAGEKTFQLIYQSAGRSGRGEIPGEVVIQSYNPDNTVIKHATNLELKKYYDVCLQERKSLDYPPFSWIVKFEVRGTKKNLVENLINRIADSIKHTPKGIEKLGPAYCYREKLKDHYRMQIIFKSKKKYDPIGTRLKKFYNSIIINSKINDSRNPRLIVDVNPTSLL